MPSPTITEFALVPDKSWDELGIEPHRIDPGLRMVAALIDRGDAQQLFRRTGMRMTPERVVEIPRVPLFVELESGERKEILASLAGIAREQGYPLEIPAAYLDERARLAAVTSVFTWLRRGEEKPGAAGVAFRQGIATLLGMKGVKSISLPNPLQPMLEDSLRDIGLPADRTVNGRLLTGEGVIVGVIDDGCALAHPNFLVPGTRQSRVLFLWDQGAAAPQGRWTSPGNFPGRELTKARIDEVLAGHVADGRIDEDAVYEELGYEVGIASHGTHVLDIAAGNGASLIGSAGVASKADIIFVQLPRDLVEQGGPVLESHVLDGVEYIFDRAAKAGKQAVVNISFGGYSGPHDGTSVVASSIDALLQFGAGRAVVVSAGNGFEADCHMQGTVPAPGARGHGQGQAPQAQLAWLLSPEDPTANQLEIWYGGAASLDVLLQPPGAGEPLPPVAVGERRTIVRVADNKEVGSIDNAPHPNGSHVIRIELNATEGESLAATSGAAQPAMPPSLEAPVPSGAWTITLANRGGAPCPFHAWIARDDLRTRSGRRRQQSRFPQGDADPWSTVADLACGHLSICVGAHNAATGEMCAYSACGPTRDGRAKPDLTAPAEGTAAGGGVLCASSRRSQPSRFNGTSAAAPHVAGLVALLMQDRQALGAPPLGAGEIRDKLMAGAAAELVSAPERKAGANRRQEADPRRPSGKRQSHRFAEVIGSGKANVPKSMA
jgi:subtilisin family serine protease